jgi:hypothetical protein
MTELERALVVLGNHLELPPEPDLSAAVRALLTAPPRRRHQRRLVLALALAALALLAAALAVPSARTTLLRWFHLRGVTIERVDTLPPTVERPLLYGLGHPLPPAEASKEVGFEVLLPRAHGEVARVYVTEGLASMVLRVNGRNVLLNQFHARDIGIVKKFTGEATVIRHVVINGRSGFWLEGGPHIVNFLDRYGRSDYRETRFAGNVLLWTRGRVTLRLEGPIGEKTAIEIARGVR